MLGELIRKNRSYRRFCQEVPIALDTLREFVDLARLSASGGNRQPLKYLLSNTAEKNTQIFKELSWAGYLQDWNEPAEGERPSAYIIILGDNEISQKTGCDQGIAAQSIMLGAVEKGFGGCIPGTVDRQNLCEVLKVPPRYEISLTDMLLYYRNKRLMAR